MEKTWDWFDVLQSGNRPRPRVEVWPRGGGKSSTGELGCVRVGIKLARRFVLYVCETQKQADGHVQAVSSLFEKLGVGRSVNQYGNSKGWKRDQLRTENGFNVSAIGLDTAARGVKLDEFRPDLIIFDDIDGRHDTAATVRKKKEIITENLLPAGSTDCAVLFLQNLIHCNSIVSQLVNGNAEFLYDREVPTVEKAVNNLAYELRAQPDGTFRYIVTGGEPTWVGQDLQICEHQINTWGLPAFLRESQQEVDEAGWIFKSAWFDERYKALPKLNEVWSCWDTALKAKEENDETACTTAGIGVDGYVYILRVTHGRWETPDVAKFLVAQAAWYRQTYGDAYRGDYIEDKVSGITLMQYLRRSNPEIVLIPIGVEADKVTRAHGVTPLCETNRVRFPDTNAYSGTAEWVTDTLTQLKGFPNAAHDDIVDSFVYSLKRVLGTLGGKKARRGRGTGGQV